MHDHDGLVIEGGEHVLGTLAPGVLGVLEAAVVTFAGGGRVAAALVRQAARVGFGGVVEVGGEAVGVRHENYITEAAEDPQGCSSRSFENFLNKIRLFGPFVAAYQTLLHNTRTARPRLCPGFPGRRR